MIDLDTRCPNPLRRLVQNAAVERGLQAYPWWAPYHGRAAPRQIPVIMLEPVNS
jgi:hypothetical protein